MRERSVVQVRARGRSLVEEQFTWPKVAAEFGAVYSGITGTGPKPDSLIAG